MVYTIRETEDDKLEITASVAETDEAGNVSTKKATAIMHTVPHVFRVVGRYVREIIENAEGNGGKTIHVEPVVPLQEAP